MPEQEKGGKIHKLHNAQIGCRTLDKEQELRGIPNGCGKNEKAATYMELRVMQVNVQRSSLAMNQLRGILERKVIDIVIFQEPYLRAGHVLRMGKTHDCARNPIKMRSDNLQVLKILKYCNQHQITVLIEKQGEELLVISSYLQFEEI